MQPTRILERFLAVLGGRAQPVLLDLGPVVGANVTFFCGEIGCKILVEDLFADVDRHVREARIASLPGFLETRLSQTSGTIDGVLCWDLFDYLERPAAEKLSAQLTRVLRPDGMLLAFFGTADPALDSRPVYTRHVIVSRTQLQHRPYAAARCKQRPLLNRDIQRLFEPLRLTENVLLKSSLREVLFRKAAASGAVPTGGQADG